MAVSRFPTKTLSHKSLFLVNFVSFPHLAGQVVGQKFQTETLFNNDRWNTISNLSSAFLTTYKKRTKHIIHLNTLGFAEFFF